MTVAVMVKVFDGLVLAADSATTLSLSNGDHQVYNNANKIFHLHRELPVGAMTWGLGNVADASIATIAKDARQRFMGQTTDADLNDAWRLDSATYTVEQAANRMIDLIFDELDAKSIVSPQNTFGLLVAGYSANTSRPEAWVIRGNTTNERPVALLEAGQDTGGWASYAQADAVTRLFKGLDPVVAHVLQSELDATSFGKVMQAIQGAGVEEPMAQMPMPFADAIKLAEFMVETTIGYSRFRLGADTVGGPVEVAGISRHEGFKWVKRKHYFTTDLNPGG